MKGMSDGCPYNLPGLAARVFFSNDGGATCAVIDVPDTKDPFELLKMAAARVYNQPPNTTPRDVTRPGTAEAARQSRNTEVAEQAQPKATAPAAPDRTSTTPAAEASPPISKPPSAVNTPPRTAGVRDTSMAAHRNLKWSGQLSAQERQVIATIIGSGQPDMTRREISDASGLEINAVCGRVHKLVHGEFGILEELPSRPCRSTGETAHPVRVIMDTAVLSMIGKP